MSSLQTTAEVNQKPRDWYYRRLARHFNKALKVWVAALDSPSPTIRLQAANNIMAKIVPDIKAMEVTGAEGQPLQYTVNAGHGFIPPDMVEGVIMEDVAPPLEGSTTALTDTLVPESTEPIPHS